MPDFYPSGNTARAADDVNRSLHKLCAMYQASPTDAAEIGSYITTESGDYITDESGNKIVVG
jgi:hypothetical protein